MKSMGAVGVMLCVLAILPGARTQASEIVLAPSLFGGYGNNAYAYGPVDYGDPVPGYYYESGVIGTYEFPYVAARFDLNSVDWTQVSALELDVSFTTYSSPALTAFWLQRFDDLGHMESVHGDSLYESPHTDSGYWKFNITWDDSHGYYAVWSESSFDVYGGGPLGTFRLADFVGADGILEFGMRGTYTTSATGGTWGDIRYYRDGVWGHTDVVNSAILRVVPEPATLALVALGGLGVLARRRRR